VRCGRGGLNYKEEGNECEKTVPSKKWNRRDQPDAAVKSIKEGQSQKNRNHGRRCGIGEGFKGGLVWGLEEVVMSRGESAKIITGEPEGWTRYY